MKVVYEDSVIKRIQRAVYDADSAGRRIGYIEVTVREANELSEYVRRHLYVQPIVQPIVQPKAHLQTCAFQHYTKADAGKVVGQFYGAEIYVESAT